MADRNTLIVLTVKSIQTEPYVSYEGGMCRSATIKAVSSNRDLTFEMTTGLLNSEQVRRCELLKRHGFTVVQLPDGIPAWQRDGRGGWVDRVISSAMEKMSARYANGKEIEMTDTYDSDFADRVLQEVDKRFPNAVQTHELKFAFEDEPSDDALLTALAGLQRYGYIEGKALFSHTGPQRRLAAMANIEITAEGRKHLSGQNAVGGAAIFHGDQINNYGNAGAIGRHSIGTINQQQQWASLANQVDLAQVVTELHLLRAELIKTAKTPSDFQQLSLVAEAEQHAEKRDGAKVMDVLSKAGKGMFDFAKDVGSDITAKLIAKAMGLEP